jgi:hypothetical protein
MDRAFIILIFSLISITGFATDPVTEKPKAKKYKFASKNIPLSRQLTLGGTVLFSAGLISYVTNGLYDRSGFSGISRYTSPDIMAMALGSSLITIGIVIKL